MAPSRLAGPSQSSAASGIFFQGDAQSQSVINSQLSPSFCNSANSACARSRLETISGDINQTAPDSMASSGPSVGASSLVTDANSGFSGGPQLQRSASINTESYMRLPASPMSFSSNNISASGASVIDGPSTAQQGSLPDPNCQQVMQSQRQQQLQQGASGAASLIQSYPGQLPFAIGPRFPNSFFLDHANLSNMRKKPRLDIKQEDNLQQQVLQQLLQRQDPMQLQNYNPQLQVILQQRLQQQQQQQILQAMPQIQRVHLQQQQQLRQHLQHQTLQQRMPPNKNPCDTGGVCARRLMQYLYHQQQRPAENNIAYWRKFVAQYYAPRAKKRWCLSMYENVGHQALGVFPQAAMDVWHCDICGSKSGRGFEATYEALPRLNEIKFGSGVIDELLFLDLPQECRFVNGIMVLEYKKAIQETVYEQIRVVREGQLRIIFNQELKILSWEFCASRHEELLPRRLVAPQVNQLLHIAQKCQSAVADTGSDEVSSQDVQMSSSMVVTASRQLVTSLELQSLNDLGFSKRYVRCLQIAEVVNSMKDLVDFCCAYKLGPIDGLKNYPRHVSTPRLQMQRMEEIQHLTGIPGLSTDRNTISKLMTMQPGISNNNQHNMIANSRGGLGGPISLSSHQNVMMRQSSLNSNPSSLQHGASSVNNYSQSPSLNPSQGGQQHMIQQMLQGIHSNSVGGQQKTLGAQIMNSGTTSSGVRYGDNDTPATPAASSNVPGDATPTMGKSSSFKAALNSDSTAAGGSGTNSVSNLKALDLPQMTDDMIPDLPPDFADSMFFNSDIDDNLGYGWKAELQ